MALRKRRVAASFSSKSSHFKHIPFFPRVISFLLIRGTDSGRKNLSNTDNRSGGRCRSVKSLVNLVSRLNSQPVFHTFADESSVVSRRPGETC